jgi:ferrous iron transport protein B
VRDLVTDGVIAGVGGVLVFLPQILILFFFILILEDSGYMARAAFLLDRSMGLAGLHGRSFIPLLSSFACAVPGIMASRVIENRKDRLLVIMVAPLITCSARLPVYTLIVAALIPQQRVFGFLSMQGLVFFVLYLAGILSALLVARVLRKTALAGKPGSIIMEMPNYQMPHPRDILIGLWNRAKIFVRRAGTIILSLSIVVWIFSNFPKPPEGFAGSAVEYSLAGRIGHLLQPIFAPLGFDWAITASLVPTMAAREVFVASLSTIYAVSDADGTLAQTLAGAWTVPVALSVLAWFVYAPQCIAMLAAIRRETGSRGWTAFSIVYLFALAWAAAFVTYRSALAFGL